MDFSCKGPDSNCRRLCCVVSVSLSSFAGVAGKQPQVTHKQMGVAVAQSDCVCKCGWQAIFGLGAVAGPSLA